MGEEPSESSTPRWHRELTLPETHAIQTLLPGRGGWGRGRMVWGAARGVLCKEGVGWGPGYLLGSREGMVEAGHVSHDGFLIRSGGSNNVYQEKSGVKSQLANT